MPNNDNTLRMHWHIPLKRDWERYGGTEPHSIGARRSFRGVPIIEKESGLIVCLVLRRRSFPYTLATARAIVRANNQAVSAARKESREKKDS